MIARGTNEVLKIFCFFIIVGGYKGVPSVNAPTYFRVCLISECVIPKKILNVAILCLLRSFFRVCHLFDSQIIC